MSEHFTEIEFSQSQIALEHGISNVLPDSLKDKMLFTLAGLERVREAVGFPVIINSGYRCEALNTLVGGSPTSQHMKAEAVDFTCEQFGPPYEICLFLKGRLGSMGIDQLILEGTWVHASFTLTPRKQVLTKSGALYLNGIVGFHNT